MKKFSNLILESKTVGLVKHPLVNSVDWDEIFKPLIEHIEGNLKSNVSSPGEGIFSSKTKAALNQLIDTISEDYVEYFQNVIDDGSQESFFNAYGIHIKWNDLMDCLQPLMDRTDDIDDYPSWTGGYWYMNLVNLKFENTDELIEDILDISGKLKIFKIDFKIQIHSSATTFPNKNNFYFGKNIEEEKISKGIKNILELPSQHQRQWITGLRGVSIFIYNKETVQVIDLD